MSKTVLTYVETVALIVAVGVPAHYLVGVDWPWAIVTGAVASVLLRLVIHSEPLRGWRNARRGKVDKPAS
jgi:hypothetical protein